MFWTIAPWAEPIAIFRTRVCSIKRNDRRRPSPKSSTRVPHFIGLGRPTPRDPRDINIGLTDMDGTIQYFQHRTDIWIVRSTISRIGLSEKIRSPIFPGL